MLKWVGGKSCFEITDDSVRGILVIVHSNDDRTRVIGWPSSRL